MDQLSFLSFSRSLSHRVILDYSELNNLESQLQHVRHHKEQSIIQIRSEYVAAFLWLRLLNPSSFLILCYFLLNFILNFFSGFLNFILDFLSPQF